MTKCSNCGRDLRDDAKFCDGCAAPVEVDGAGGTTPEQRKKPRRKGIHLLLFIVSVLPLIGLVAGVIIWGRNTSYEFNWVIGSNAALEGNYLDAIEDYTDAIRLKPNAAWAHYLRATAHDMISSHHPELAVRDHTFRAISDYKAVIRLDDPRNPEHPEVYMRLAQCFARIGDSTEAIRYYEEYLAKFPESANREEIQKEISKLNEHD